jgi:hypothetical protein
MLKLSIYLVIRCSSCTGRSSENICSRAVEAFRKKGKRGRNSTQWFITKIGGKLVWVPVIFRFVQFDSQLCIWYSIMPSRNWPFSSPNRLTLQITFILFWFFSKTRNSRIEQNQENGWKLVLAPFRV